MGTAACTVPLAPGYRIAKETREVQFVPGDTPELRIRAGFTLVNSGTTELQFIDINLPEEKAYGRNNLHVELDGRDVTLSPLPAEYQQELPNALRLAFDPPWGKGKTQHLEIQYSFESPGDSGSRITLSASAFHLASRGWFPQPQPPKHFLAPYPGRPDKMEYTIRVPDGDAVLAGGTPAGMKRDRGEDIFRYRLRKPDLPPYIVAGRYVPSDHFVKSGATIFWTLSPVQGDLSAGGAQIAAAWATLQTDFGPLGMNIAAPHVVESPGLRSHVGRGMVPAAAAFPGGALVNSEALAMGVNSDEFVELVTHALAHNWFGSELYPSTDVGLGLGEGLPEYATIVVEESREGAEGRRKRILRYLNEYDQAVRRGVEKPLAVTMLTDAEPQRRIGLAKAPLFFAAVEDDCGEAPMRQGLAHMVALLKGQEVGYDDLRSALEQSCGKPLGDIFRQWLNVNGIPGDFRQRYQGTAVREVIPDGASGGKTEK